MWLTVALLVGVAIYVVRVVAPVVVPPGRGPRSRKRQRLCFRGGSGPCCGVSAGLGPCTTSPRSTCTRCNMVQAPAESASWCRPLLLMAVPEWAGPGSSWSTAPARPKVIGRLVHPLVAAVVFNALQGLMHWSTLVELSVRSGPFHYAMHLLMFASAAGHVDAGGGAAARAPPVRAGQDGSTCSLCRSSRRCRPRG